MADKLSDQMHAWNKGAEDSSHFRIPTFVFVRVTQLEQRVEDLEEAGRYAVEELGQIVGLAPFVKALAAVDEEPISVVAKSET